MNGTKFIVKMFNVVANTFHAKKTKSKISFYAILNRKTVLEGRNKIGNANIKDSFFGYGSYIVSGNLSNCSVGRFCSIGNNVNIITANHPIHFVSTFPGFYKTTNKDIFTTHSDILFQEFKLHSNGRAIIIGNDVWIGDNVTIFGGLTIGNGAIIGANSLVTKDVKPYSIVGGVPAKLIKFRFPEQSIDMLQKLQWWTWSLEYLKVESKYFNDIDGFLKRHYD